MLSHRAKVMLGPALPVKLLNFNVYTFPPIAFVCLLEMTRRAFIALRVIRLKGQMTRRAFSVITVFIISNSVEERVDVCSTTPPSKVLEIENLIFFSAVQKIHIFPIYFNDFFFS